MDTKSKKFSYSTGIKALALLLAVVFVGVAACSALFLVQFAADSGATALYESLKKNEAQFELSRSFTNETNKVMIAIKQYYGFYREGAVFEDGSLEKTLEEQREKAIDEVVENEFRTRRIEVENYNTAFKAANATKSDNYYVDEYGDVYYYYGNNSLNDFMNDSHFIINDDGTVSTNEAEWRKTVNVSVGSISEHREYFAALKKLLESLKSLNYIYVDNASGKVFSNTKASSLAEYKNGFLQNRWGLLTDDSAETVRFSDKALGLIESRAGYGSDYYNNNQRLCTIDGEVLNDAELQYCSELCEGIYRGAADGAVIEKLYGVDLFFDLSKLEFSLAISYSPIAAESGEPNDLFGSLNAEYNKTFSNLRIYFIVTCVSLLFALIVLCWLVKHSGRQAPEAEVKKLWEDRIYNDIHLVLSGTVLFGLAVLAVIAAKYYFDTQYLLVPDFIILIGYIACACAMAAVFTDYVCSVARHVKCGTFFKHTLVLAPFRLIRKLWKGSQEKAAVLPDGIIRLMKICIPLWIIGNLGLLLLIVFAASQSSALFTLFFAWLLLGLNVVSIYYLVTYAKALDKIRHTVEQAHAGNYEAVFDCAKMPVPLRKLADEISDMRDGMQTAVNNAVKDQRTKAELITNVSHDLKTPLTSIINYTDLISRCDIQDETVRGYIEILSEKSVRLKRLIEDLTEATKAATGNVEIHPVNVSLYELALQSLGESEDDLLAAGIETRMTPTDLRPMVFADSQKTFRVIDNLLSNVRKYALPGTRAYITIEERGCYGALTVKNISRSALDIAPEQLMERFVRGDSSRAGEGSGLGLSIAKDLCELQCGKFELEIDGDLFKATVLLPLAAPTAAPVVEEIQPEQESLKS